MVYFGENAILTKTALDTIIRTRTLVRLSRNERRTNMNSAECELIGLIRESDDPGRALTVAVDVITSYLMRRGSSGGQDPADWQELGGTS